LREIRAGGAIELLQMALGLRRTRKPWISTTHHAGQKIIDVFLVLAHLLVKNKL
jgi:hypothetical protein